MLLFILLKRIGVFDYGIIGLLDCGIIGLLDYGVMGLLDYWIMELWVMGLLNVEAR